MSYFSPVRSLPTDFPPRTGWTRRTRMHDIAFHWYDSHGKKESSYIGYAIQTSDDGTTSLVRGFETPFSIDDGRPIDPKLLLLLLEEMEVQGHWRDADSRPLKSLGLSGDGQAVVMEWARPRSLAQAGQFVEDALHADGSRLLMMAHHPSIQRVGQAREVEKWLREAVATLETLRYFQGRLEENRRQISTLRACCRDIQGKLDGVAEMGADAMNQLEEEFGIQVA